MTDGEPLPGGPNAEQIRYWNETAGPKWVALQDVLDAQLEALGQRVMSRLGIGPGDRVLDVGCGCGQSTLELARRVAPDGRATGLDVSAVMLERARSQAAGAGAIDVEFVLGDAQTHAFARSSFDALFSRFGVMFFADPEAAFANLRGALRPGGRLGFLCWQALQENPWLLVPLTAAAAHVTLAPPAAPEAPGPFAFADRERLARILAGAGFRDVLFENHRAMLTVGGGENLDRAVDLMMQMGPAGAALRTAEPDVRIRVADAMRDALAPHRTPEGVRLASASWLVAARV
jgi:SAM-dependent methyltransferase